MFKDFKTTEGYYITIKPLNLFDREELIKRVNSLDKFTSVNTMLLDENSYNSYQLKKILSLYDIEIEEISIEDVSELVFDYILPVNFPYLDQNPKGESNTNKKVLDETKSLAKIFSQIWGLCESAAEALFIIRELPAEFLLSAAEYRSEDLERMYSTEEDKRKKQKREAKKAFEENAVNLSSKMKELVKN